MAIKNYQIKEGKNSITIKNMEDFNPKHIFECGQAFRWKLEEDESYTLISQGRLLNVKKEKDDIVFKGTNLQEFSQIWYNYFDLGRDYGLIKKTLSKDPILKKAILYADGIRILRQEPFETIISFIISANNQIPRIKNSIEIISENYGERLDSHLGTYYSFPSAEELGRLEVGAFKEVSRVGFRAERIIETSKIIDKREIDLDSLYKTSKNQGKETLMQLPGVGPKVSECILLFAFSKGDAFPVDTWVKRVMEHFYLKKESKLKEIEEFGAKKFGKLAGYAQQYLFYYAREEKIGK